MRQNADSTDFLEGEVAVWSLDHKTDATGRGGTLVAITEGALRLVRLRVRFDTDYIPPSTRIELREDSQEGNVIERCMGEMRLRDCNAGPKELIAEVIDELIKANPEPFLAFFNRAGFLSLKMHAFQLLPRIGASKANSMQKMREREGWASLEVVNEVCKINSSKLLAERFKQELEDPSIQPRLLELLVRAG